MKAHLIIQLTFLAFLSLVMRINCAPPTSGNQTTVPPVSVITQKIEVQEEDEKVGVTEKVTNETTTATPPTTVSPSPKPVETTTKTTKLPLPDPSSTASVSGINEALYHSFYKYAIPKTA